MKNYAVSTSGFLIISMLPVTAAWQQEGGNQNA